MGKLYPKGYKKIEVKKGRGYSSASPSTAGL